MPRAAVRPWVWAGLVALAAAGCAGDPNRPSPVRGVVVYEDGQPAKELAGGSVTFTAVAEGVGSSVGTIQEDASFRLSYKKEGDGAVPGRHHVIVAPPEPEDEDGDRPKARRAKAKALLDPASLNQEVTVERGQDVTLKVRRAGGAKK